MTSFLRTNGIIGANWDIKYVGEKNTMKTFTGAGCFVNDAGETMVCFVRDGKIEIIDGFSADTADTDLPRVLSDFHRLARNLESGNIKFSKDSDLIKEEFGKQPITPAALTDSNVITSHVVDNTSVSSHKIAIDLDMDAALIPSSTKGHYHLIIEKYLPWYKYRIFLEALKNVGLIQLGYYEASISRGSTVLRTPWTKK